MLTGCAPHNVNMLGLAHRGFGPVDASRHLARYLQLNGYHTVLAGIQHETSEAGIPALGYQERISASPGSDGEPDLQVAKNLTDRLKRGFPDSPLFLSVGAFLPHRPFPGLQEGDEPGRLQPPIPVSDSAAGRRDFAEYRAAVGVTDRCFGLLCDSLRELGIYDDSVIVVTTDHGPAFPGMKCSLHDQGIEVALIIRPSSDSGFAPRISDALVSHLDLFPTICGLAGLPAPEWLQGRSLVPLLDGRRNAIREELFSEVTYHAAYQPMRCIRTNRYKLIRHFDPERCRPVLANVDGGHEKRRLLAAGWDSLRYADLELYDLETDPYEMRNRADDPALANVRVALWRRLEDWMEKTGDPLCQSQPRVPAPAGAVVNALESRDSADKLLE